MYMYSHGPGYRSVPTYMGDTVGLNARDSASGMAIFTNDRGRSKLKNKIHQGMELAWTSFQV